MRFPPCRIIELFTSAENIKHSNEKTDSSFSDLPGMNESQIQFSLCDAIVVGPQDQGAVASL